MPKLPILKPLQLVKILQKTGFEPIHQTGSHLILKNNKTNKLTTVPIHPGDIKKGLLKNIMRQAEITLEELLKQK